MSREDAEQQAWKEVFGNKGLKQSFLFKPQNLGGDSCV
jgi:hypothetical protein